MYILPKPTRSDINPSIYFRDYNEYVEWIDNMVKYKLIRASEYQFFENEIVAHSALLRNNVFRYSPVNSDIRAQHPFTMSERWFKVYNRNGVEIHVLKQEKHDQI